MKSQADWAMWGGVKGKNRVSKSTFMLGVLQAFAHIISPPPLLQIEILKVTWSKQLARRRTTGNGRTFLPETTLAVASSSHWGNANWADKKVEVRGKISELRGGILPNEKLQRKQK